MPTTALAFPGVDAAIAQIEGFGKPGTLATVDNNPGNIITGNYAKSQGAIGANNGFAVFPDVATGLQATDNLVGYYANKGASIQDLINSWAPASAGNNPTSYAKDVANAVGATPSTPLSSLNGATPVANSTAGAILNGIIGTTPLGLGSTIFGVTWSRFAAFALGLIFIVGGLYLLKPTQTIVTSAARGLIAA